LLAVEIHTAETYLQCVKPAKSQQVAEYFAQIIQLLAQKGYRKVDIFLDHNPTHQRKMQQIFYQLNQTQLKVRFFFLPPYSPWLNPVEFLIHLIRQKELHHHSPDRQLEEIEKICVDKIHNQNYFAQENLLNIIEHIEQKILDKYTKTKV